MNLIFNVNALNELTNVFRSPGSSLTVAGVSSLVATSVTVNADSAQLFSDNTFVRTNALLADGTNTYVAVATSADGSNASATVSVNLPASANYLYDGRGNLTNDGLRSFEYDDENQLKAAMVPYAWRSEFAYDGLHRRRIRRERTWNGTWVTASEVHYIYDGRVVVQERNGNNVPLVTYTRGLDLSGSLQDAGGIGGLLARTENPTLTTAYYHCDGNGNVTCMVDASGSVVARYAYDPFGNILAMSGTLAEANLYRFSSKEAHPNSGLVYYLYRYYEPNLQRWLNRDPIDEAGGLNLYSFCGNAPVSWIDLLGLRDYNCTETQKILAQAYASSIAGALQGLENIRENSQGGGKYDFYYNGQKDDTFNVNSEKLTADEFGNFIAGFQGQAYDNTYWPPVALDTVKAAGIYYHATGQTKANNDPLDHTGRPKINEGAKYAKDFLQSPLPCLRNTSSGKTSKSDDSLRTRRQDRRDERAGNGRCR